MHEVTTSRLIAGRYRLKGQIGRGAMGIVWRGRDELLDRDVAVKEVQLAAAGAAERDTAYQRTLREAKTAARLSHPGLVTVFDVVEEHGSPWIVMELVGSRSLDQVVAEDGPLRPAEAADVGDRLLSALACAHAAGVLHRDVKPSNVLITPDGGAVLTDFGIATFEGDPGLTQAGVVVGTPSFTAPERVRGEPATPASDLWSLGATLYAAVEGRGPFDRPGGSAMIMAGVISEDAPQAPSAGPLGPVIEALLRKDPAARPDARAAAGLLAAAAQQARAGPALSSGTAEPAVGSTSAERRVADAQTVPAGFPEPPGSAAFADVHEFPDLSASADAPESMELPAFMDLPSAPALLLGQSPPWSQPSPAGSRESLGMPGSGSSAVPGAAGGAGQPAVAGTPAPNRRGRALIATAGLAAVAAAAIIGWAFAPRPTSSATGAVGQAVQPARGGHASGGTRHGAKHRGQPGFPGGRGAAGGAVASSSRAAAGGSGSQQSGGTGPGSGGQSGSQPDGGTKPAPVGYRWVSVSAVTAGSIAGFKIAIPVAWQATTSGLVTYLDAAVPGTSIEINLAAFDFAKPLREAEFLQAQAISQGEYAGYQLVAISQTTYRSVPAATWRFNWQPGMLSHASVLEVLFGLQTSAGPQDYALTVSAPSVTFPAAHTVFNEVLRSFQPVS
jgi:eukaryotic-like serine/threonine-protein kinase